MMKQSFISIVLMMMFLFVACEEYYKPVMDVLPGTLVIESRLTNDQSQNFVRLSLTRNFTGTDAVVWITSARVDLIEVGGDISRATENGPGYYTFSKLPVIGKKYQLRVSSKGDVYLSDMVVMPPLPSIDSLYARHKIQVDYKVDGFGVPQKIETPGREIYIDASITPGLKYNRFSSREVLQWIYYPPPMAAPWFGWVNVSDKGIFNLAGPKDYSMSEKIKVHPLFSLPYNSQQFLDSAAQLPAGWIAIIDQYGITKESYDFHKKLNQQFTAEGSLFDPVLTQVNGNMHCKNDTSKIVLGYFDLNSYRQSRYFLEIGNNEKSPGIVRKINEFHFIPADGYLDGVYPVFWENNNN
jgi:hypothetical protein